MPTAYRPPTARSAHFPRQPQRGGILVGARTKRKSQLRQERPIPPRRGSPIYGTGFYRDSAPDGAVGAYSQGEPERGALLPQSRDPFGEGREVVGMVREALRPGREAQIPGYPAPIRVGSRTGSGGDPLLAGRNPPGGDEDPSGRGGEGLWAGFDPLGGGGNPAARAGQPFGGGERGGPPGRNPFRGGPNRKSAGSKEFGTGWNLFGAGAPLP